MFFGLLFDEVVILSSAAWTARNLCKCMWLQILLFSLCMRLNIVVVGQVGCIEVAWRRLLNTLHFFAVIMQAILRKLLGIKLHPLVIIYI